MLVDPRYLVTHAAPIAALTAVIVVGKAVLALGICLVLRQPVRTGLVVAAGLSQIREFSFILGLAGLKLGMLQREQYAMILSGRSL
jgi:CPA2 family monovalent cation:H+ antiporter-2